MQFNEVKTVTDIDNKTNNNSKDSYNRDPSKNSTAGNSGSKEWYLTNINPPHLRRKLPDILWPTL